MLRFLGVIISTVLAAHPVPGLAWAPIRSNTRVSTALQAANDANVSRRNLFSIVGTGALVVAVSSQPASARLEAVNRPDLLPSEPGRYVIQIERFLTKGQEKRLNDLLAATERDTGYRIRVLCQSYPNTPGLAIRDYWDLGKEVRIGTVIMLRQ